MDEKRPLPPRILKVYDVISPPQFKLDNFEIRIDGKPILWTTIRNAPFEQSKIELQSAVQGNPIVAAAKLIEKSNGCRIILGNPADLTKPHWDLVACESAEWGVYHFTMGWRNVKWERAPPSIDSSESSSHDSEQTFKLVDVANEQLLASYCASSRPGEKVAQIEYMVDDGPDMELLGLAALFGILERIRRVKRKRSRSWSLSRSSSSLQ